MASRAPEGRASALPLSLIAQAVPKLTRHDLEALTERLIDRLDEIDGDADSEDTDFDEAVDDKPCDEDSDSEPDFATHDGACSDAQANLEHRARIRKTRCVALRQSRLQFDQRDGPIYGWRLWNEPTVPTKRQLIRRKRGVPRRPRG